MFTIALFHQSSGKPAKNIAISVVFWNIFRRETRWHWSDSQGQVHFDYSAGGGDVYIKDFWLYSKIHSDDLAGRVVVYI